MWKHFPVPPPNPAGSTAIRSALGELLYTNYLLPFEVAGVILLVAIIAAVALTLRKRTGIKTQDPAGRSGPVGTKVSGWSK